jgi:hypothetical protein
MTGIANNIINFHSFPLVISKASFIKSPGLIIIL